MKLFNKVAIVGVGLIGGSMGLEIKKKGLADEVIGIGHHKKSIDEALRIKAIDRGYLEIKEIKDADLVVLAAPVSAIIKQLPEVEKAACGNCIVIDVGSTKSEIMKMAHKLALDFIGCHPLAGIEKKGALNARPGLFENSFCLITPSVRAKKESIDKVCAFWQALGLKTKVITAASHDAMLSFISHLPHAVAFSLIDCINPAYFKFASGGLKDTTRIVSSDPRIWQDIFITNKRAALLALKKFKKSLANLESLIKKGNPDKLHSFLKKAKDKRDGF